MQTSNTKALILTGSAIALGTLGLALLRWTGTGDAAPEAEAARAGAPRAAIQGLSRASLPARQWSPDTTYVYEIESARALSMHGDNGPGKPRSLAVSGRLSISVVGPKDDGILLRFALDPWQPAGGGPAALGASAELSRAFYAVAEPSGKLASFSFPRGVGSNGRGILKGLASSLQLVVPDPAAAAWRATELDASGEYEAAYTASGGAIEKRKERYLRAYGSRGLRPIEDASFQVASSIEIGLDASGWPRTMSEDEALAVAVGAMRIEAKSKTKARLVGIAPAAGLARLAAAEGGELEPEAAADAQGFADARRRADEGLVDGASFATLLGDLAAADVKLRNRTMARLAALFRVHPEEAARAAAAILGGELAKEATKRLIGSLGGAGTAEAQAALASVIERAPSAEARHDAAASLGLTKQPTEASKQALMKAAASSDRRLASAAALGLGNLAKRMSGAGDASDAISALIRRLEAAASDEERVLYLDALGNSGDARALAAIEPYLAHAEVRVRAAAVEALRFMPGADAKIAAGLQDGASAVRRAAASGLSHRAITPMLALVTLTMKRDPDTGTRLALVNAMQLRKRQEPNLIELLSWAAANDPAAEVKSAAKRAISST